MARKAGKNYEKKKVNPSEEKILNYLLQGLSRTEAFVKVYPSRSNYSRERIYTFMSNLMAKTYIQERYDILLKEFQEKEKIKTGWTREEAVKTLRFVVDKNIEEVERINEAFEDDLSHLAELMKQNPDEASRFMQEILKRRKTRRMSQVNNKGIIDAAAELNKMSGFNEQTINLNETVVFSGEQELED